MIEKAVAPYVHRRAAWLLGLPLAGALWWLAYVHLTDFADAVVRLLGLSRDTRFGEAVHFFLYDTPKVLLLLVGGGRRHGCGADLLRPRALLAGRRLGVGNGLAALLGIVTPFCSCSAVPLFIGFLSAGVPLGVTFSFLISAPEILILRKALRWPLIATFVGVVAAGILPVGYVFNLVL